MRRTISIVYVAAALVVTSCGGASKATPDRALPHLDSSGDVAATISAGGEAEWLSRPSSVRQAAREAESGVIATVVGVVSGPPLVAAPDEVNETRLVTLDVRDRWFGGVSSQFMINWLSGTLGDPPYAVGQDYVLFLVPRDDGPWYRPSSPDGRVQILGGRLRAVIDGEMAAEVAKMTLADAKRAAAEGRR